MLSKCTCGKYYEVSSGRSSVRIAISQVNYVGTIVEQFDIYANSVMPDIIDNKEVVDFSYPRWHLLPKRKTPIYLNSFSEGDEHAAKSITERLRHMAFFVNFK
jgi:hypothetical protein